MKTVYAAVYMYTTLHTFMFNGGGGRNTITISLSNSLDMYSWISLSIYLFAKGRMLSLEYTVTSR